MQFTNLATMTVLLPVVLGIPLKTRDSRNTTIQSVPQAIATTDPSELAHQPATLSSDAIAFLSKYQTYSNKAYEIIGPQELNQVSAAGWCFQEDPCFNVYQVSVVSIPPTSGALIPALIPTQVSSLLDSILATPYITYSEPNDDSVFSGINLNVDGTSFGVIKITIDGAVLEIIAPEGTVDTTIVVGMVIDAYKSSIGPNTNAVQALGAQRDFPTVICLYPEGVAPVATRTFCVGKELDGSEALSVISERWNDEDYYDEYEYFDDSGENFECKDVNGRPNPTISC